MNTAAELHAEAARMRAFALLVTDGEVLEAIQAMIDELERRARELGNGAESDMMMVHFGLPSSPEIATDVGEPLRVHSGWNLGSPAFLPRPYGR